MSATHKRFDLSYLHSIVGDDQLMFDKLIHIFIRDSSSTLDALSLAAVEGDYMAIKRLAHGLKGVCSTLEMDLVTEDSLKIEALAMRQEGLSEIQAMIGEIRAELDVTLPELGALVFH